MDLQLTAKLEWGVLRFKTYQEIQDLEHLFQTLNSENVINKELFFSYESRFAHLIRSNLLMQVVSIIEFNLIEICKILKVKYNQFPSLLTKGNSQVGIAKDYLRKAINLDIEKLPDYQYLDFIQKTRNKIIHNNCVCDTPELHKFLREEGSFTGIYYFDAIERKNLFKFEIGSGDVIKSTLKRYEKFIMSIYEYILINENCFI